MPREIRKRGKKKPKAQDTSAENVHETVEEARGIQHNSNSEAPEAGPSWMRANPPAVNDLEAPFGYVDADVKAYFRTVDIRMREWQAGEGEEMMVDIDPNEERQTFVSAALSEISGKELQLSTDPDCSTILERMGYSMDDFSRRVFVDRLAGSYDRLARHRFASHVCQTYFALARDSVSRETRNVASAKAKESVPDPDDLRTMTQLILDAAEELLSFVTKLILDPFGSHVIQSLLALLVPSLTPQDPSNTGPVSGLRSKKSAAYKARQGPMKSVLATVTDKQPTVVPPEFDRMAGRFLSKLREDLNDNEIRALASDKVASPTLQMILRFEAGRGEAETSGSLMDRVLMGLITRLLNGDELSDREDYLETLIRDPTSSHLLEVLIQSSPPKVFRAIWEVYFSGRLAKLIIHPVANFVIAKGLERIDSKEGLEDVLNEVGPSWDKTIKSGRTGVLRALVDAAAASNLYEKEVVEAVCNAFGLSEDEERKMLVPCALRLKTLEDVKGLESVRNLKADTPNSEEHDASHSRRHVSSRGKQPSTTFTVQGAVILQSMLRLHEPHNDCVLNSIAALSTDDLLDIARDPSGSRVLDLVLESPTVPPRSRRKLMMSFIGHYHVLVDDKLGSRVADRCWAGADPYLRERIARTLMPHERFLAGSFYGKFFARHLHLSLLQRKPEEWKALQTRLKNESLSNQAPNAREGSTTSASAPAVPPSQAAAEQSFDSNVVKSKSKKRKGREDDIEDIFAHVDKGKAHGRTKVLATADPANSLAPRDDAVVDPSLKDILGAIKEIPKGQALREGKRRKKTKA